MNLYIFIGILAGGIVIILIALVMLNRAWGDFPGQASGLPPAQPPMSSLSPPPVARSLSPPPGSLQSVGELPAGAPAGSMVPVTHPMVRQAVIAALERGGSPYALYFIKDGETVYLVPSRIADLQQREIATRIFTSLNRTDGGGLSFSDIVRVMQELGRK